MLHRGLWELTASPTINGGPREQAVSKLWYYADSNSSGHIGPLTLERLQSISQILRHCAVTCLMKHCDMPSS
jgi:hypothetical protein